MKVWIGIAVGLVLVTILAAAVSADDHTGDSVRAEGWADDVCGAVGTWEGQMGAIGRSVRSAGAAARENDGGSGDQVSGTFLVRAALTRAIQATDITLGEGLERAGIPDANQGEQASQTLLDWAQETEDGLRSARATMERERGTQAESLATLSYAVDVMRESLVNGRAAFEDVAGLDSELEDALGGSRNCEELRRDEP